MQFATNAIDEGLRAAHMAEEAGAAWVDLNCGCPIYDATRRGLGTKMLEKPNKLERLVSEIAAATPLPLTVKIRTGQNASKINVHKARCGTRGCVAPAGCSARDVGCSATRMPLMA